MKSTKIKSMLLWLFNPLYYDLSMQLWETKQKESIHLSNARKSHILFPLIFFNEKEWKTQPLFIQ